MSEPTLPIEELLAPVNEESPCGQSLRLADDAVATELRDVRDLAWAATKLERKAGDAGEDPTFAASAEWGRLKDQCCALLREKSKDLEVTAVLVEAQVRIAGVAGLADGFSLVNQLVERYWSDILDRSRKASDESTDDKAVSEQVGRMIKWNDTLPLPIARIPITAGGDAGQFALWQYEQAVAAENLSAEERERRKSISLSQFTLSVASTGRLQPAMLRGLVSDIQRAHEQADKLEVVFQERLTGDLADKCPTLTKVKERLDDMKRCLMHTGKEFLEPSEGQAAEGATAGAAAIAGGVSDREQAFRELSRIADFFARTEPLSLLAEQIRQVVHRGRLSPDQYYSELIDNQETLRQFFRLVGIKKSAEGESSE
jgi:type VI secretion system protein ImpA